MEPAERTVNQLKPETMLYASEHGLDVDRVLFWKDMAEERRKKYSRDFVEFTRGHEDIVSVGNGILLDYQGTGLNILLEPSDMDITKDEPLIFYNNYIGRTEHFGLVLAEMEKEGIITKDQVSFGNKCSTVLYTLWDIDPDDEIIRQIKHPTKNVDRMADQTVETVVTFRPTNDDNATRILSFLRRKTVATNPNAVPGSWEIQDIRATKALASILLNPELGGGFKLVKTNMLSREGAQLLVMRQKTEFADKPGWALTPTIQNSTLVEYLVNDQVIDSD